MYRFANGIHHLYFTVNAPFPLTAVNEKLFLLTFWMAFD